MRAVSRGHLVPDGDHAGVVHSVFAHSCNLAVAGTLVTVHDSGAPHTPTSVRVPGESGRRWTPPVRVGLPVRFERDRIRIGSGGAERTVDLSAAAVWSPGPARPVTAEQARAAAARLETAGRAHPPGGAAAEVGEAVGTLRLALLSGSGEDVAAAALIGLGPGLTPSGDDVLVGVLAALLRAGGPASRPAADAIARAVSARERATTDVSRHYLRLAVAGHFGEPLTDLIDGFAGASPAGERERVRRVLAVGASSGADALAGVALGMAVVASNVTTRGEKE